MTSLKTLCSATLIALLMTSPLLAQKKETEKASKDFTVYPVAVFPFAERGRDAEELGSKVTDLLFVNLVTNPDLYLVEREEIDKLFTEQELNKSGLVDPGKATQIGYLTGAKILVTGSVLVVGDKLYVVAKIIGTETSRVLGASAKGNIDDELDGLVEELAMNVAATISERSKDLVAKPVTKEDRLAALVKKLGKGKRPSVWIDIPERHIGQTTYDPAAETELTLFCKELGFEVIDHQAGNRKDADVVLIGEGFSQFAARHSNLISVKARLEVKALDQNGKVLAIDRQTSVAVDLAEHIAGKTALQDAAVNIAERLLPKLVTDSGKKRSRNRKK